MDNLNDDVLHAIFVHTLPSIIIYNIPVLPGAAQVVSVSPFNLSLVCRSWRTLVLSSPSLWSSFNFVLDESYGSHCTSEIFSRMLKYWLRLSSSSSLSFRYSGYVGRNRIAHETLYLIVQEQHRWKNVSITLRGQGNSTDDDALAAGLSVGKPFLLDCIPQLVSVKLIFANLGNSFGTLDLSKSVVEKPSSLKALDLGPAAKLKLPREIINFHLPHLQNLNCCISCPSTLKEMRNLLASSPSLASLGLKTIGVNVPKSFFDNMKHKIITLPHLTNVTFHSLASSTDTCRLLLGTLSCPSLLSLKVDVQYQSEGGIISPKHYQDLLLRSSPAYYSESGSRLTRPLKPEPPLVELWLKENFWYSRTAPQQCVDARAFADLFRHLGSLERLYIDTHDATPLFRTLSVASNGSQKGKKTSLNSGEILLPMLSEISLRSSNVFDGVASSNLKLLDEASEMVVSRWRCSESRLQRVFIGLTIWNGISWPLFIQRDERILACVKEGLVFL